METGAKPSTYVYTKPARVGDPISAANAAYYFTIPLLGLGGPMDLRFELIYRSDYWRDFQCLPWQFWWRPFAYAQSGTVINSIEYITVYLPNGDHVSFKKSAGEWVLTDPSVDVYGYVYKDNIPPTKYRLKETAGFAYLMDPINELVCIFERLMESNNYFRIRRILDRNGNQITYTYSTNMQQPTKIEDGLGRSLSFTYESISHWDYIKTVTDQGGRKIEFKYEALGK
jgi:hypothetical protein